MGEIIEILAKETDGKSFKSHRYCYDEFTPSNIEYDYTPEVEWKTYGETERRKKPVNLKYRADNSKDSSSIFKYFLDGSRRIFKVDDISYNNNVFPILAGQIGVGCCKKIDKVVSSDAISLKIVIALPDIAYRDEWESEIFFSQLKNKLNDNNTLNKKLGRYIDDILVYKTDKDEKYEKKGIAKIQDYMVEQEKLSVANMANANKLNHESYLIKDGSIEYKYIPDNKLNLTVQRVQNNYKYVIGVSKSFDPTKCYVKGGGTNSDFIAGLKPYERTPVYMYHSKIAGDVYFAIWYLRLRDAKYTNNVFDGVLKIEKLVVNQEEIDGGVDSETIDHISASLINERNPVCYGGDFRWANHLYPIYLTESYIKSQYLSNNLFLQLF